MVGKPAGRRTSVGLIVSLAACAMAHAAEAQRPAFSFLRQNEDWSVLAGESELHGWDAIKYVPLTEDGSLWANFGGTLRLRVEDWSGFAFGAPAVDDDTFVLGRVLAHADVHFGTYARAFVEGKTAVANRRPRCCRSCSGGAFRISPGNRASNWVWTTLRGTSGPAGTSGRSTSCFPWATPTSATWTSSGGKTSSARAPRCC